jgi:hypothetical protein
VTTSGYGLANGDPTGGRNKQHGLQLLVDSSNADSLSYVSTSGVKPYPIDGWTYIRAPDMGPPMPGSAGAWSATANDQGTPRQKDSYILISAGPDRTYGTKDDIANFGEVAP